MKIFTGETEELRILAILTEARKEGAVVLCDKKDIMKFIDHPYSKTMDIQIIEFSLREVIKLEEMNLKYIIDKFEMLFPLALSKMIGYGTIFNHDFKKGELN